jgi:hypothetical protein
MGSGELEMNNKTVIKVKIWDRINGQWNIIANTDINKGYLNFIEMAMDKGEIELDLIVDNRHSIFLHKKHKEFKENQIRPSWAILFPENNGISLSVESESDIDIIRIPSKETLKIYFKNIEEITCLRLKEDERNDD